MKRKIIVMLSAMGLGLLFLFSFSGASEPKKDEARLLEPVNPVFISYINNVRNHKQVNTTKTGYALNYDYVLFRGGNSWVSTAYLIRWGGPVAEQVVPYPNEAAAASNSVSPGIPQQSLPLAKHVQQVTFLPERAHLLDNNTIKYFVSNYGPVDFAFKRFSKSELPDGSYEFTGYLQIDTNYTYQVITYDGNNAITGKSLEILI